MATHVQLDLVPKAMHVGSRGIDQEVGLGTDIGEERMLLGQGIGQQEPLARQGWGRRVSPKRRCSVAVSASR